jgi:hypothetical protein
MPVPAPLWSRYRTIKATKEASARSRPIRATSSSIVANSSAKAGGYSCRSGRVAVTPGRAVPLGRQPWCELHKRAILQQIEEHWFTGILALQKGIAFLEVYST